ncbi:methyltransferase domain-containing protein [Salinimonas marina]|uniref:Methyltransferase domain-containing protein n=1 Tax=Salinimonas marina TaxID=2785918 RepID=A0A7S9DUP2_9ALTE|nr:methyltransferase domain-containing protein [Salinimonas marina]QPG04318.1 methyltransferase domain-containing protein [Salinimonas marina]
MWQCPLCQRALDTQSKTWQCAGKHSFDRAKSGYVNLLPVQNKRSLQPGDDKPMLLARRDFHQAQGYGPLMAHVSDLLTAQLPTSNDIYQLYEAGCGEGAYLSFITHALTQRGLHISAAGNDIAKVGVEMAAKKHQQAQFVVASNFSLPLTNHSQDVILQVFAPGSTSEYARVLRPGGLLVTVDPGPQHLTELKAMVYDTPQQHSAPELLVKPWTLRQQSDLQFGVDLTDEITRHGLLKMTPYTWKVTAARYQQIHQQLHSVTADFVIRIWQAPL